MKTLTNDLLHNFNRKIRLRLFKLFQKVGIHIFPVHYYSPIPNTDELLKNKHQWFKEADLSNLNYNKREESHLNEIFSNYQKEFETIPRSNDLRAQGYGLGFGDIEGLILHGFIRHFKPKNIIEVGSGVSTFYSSNAISKNLKEGIKTNLICIEPFPHKKLSDIPQVNKLIKKNVQDVNLEFFKQLNENDILFIDSSHTVKINSDVNYLFLEVLPSLKKGVFIHIHDIPFPYTFLPEEWIFERLMFFQEPVLLYALLMGNNAFEIIYCSSYLHFKSPEVLKNTFPIYDNINHFPASIWLRKIK